jgi:hypothetical protein
VASLGVEFRSFTVHLKSGLIREMAFGVSDLEKQKIKIEIIVTVVPLL